MQVEAIHERRCKSTNTIASSCNQHRPSDVLDIANRTRTSLENGRHMYLLVDWVRQRHKLITMVLMTSCSAVELSATEHSSLAKRRTMSVSRSTVPDHRAVTFFLALTRGHCPLSIHFMCNGPSTLGS